MKSARILIADDDPDILQVLGDRLSAQGYDVATARDGIEALETLRSDPPDLVLLDLMMPRMGGMEVLQRIREENLDVTALVITATGSVRTAVDAMRNGAYDFLMKPFDPQQISLTIKKALEREGLRRRNRLLTSQISESAPDLVGQSPVMREIAATAKKAAEARSTVLILGESGTGKEVLARSIHRWSDRRDNPFVAVNCVALSEDLLESEMFGHEKGAFTGAVQRKAGKFEVADGGTLFLDEIAEMKAELQAKLLRVLQEHRFERVGGTRSLDVDVRILAATNRDLDAAMASGTFRQDLYFRLNVITLRMPPLRERREDIPLLQDYFLGRFASDTKRRVNRVSTETTRLLMNYDWPGNVRELENTIERALVLGQDEEIVPDDLPAHIVDQAMREEDPDASFHGQVRRLKADLIREALRQAGGHQRRAADLLGLNPTYLSRL
ncbi:MAG TPA: sigma-54 dependent transcriptional regulator, partial [Patescibacteria group bacterium]|nr:sigma-54 dependent transcriptional regulator [Patescibacteria group bacterium]